MVTTPKMLGLRGALAAAAPLLILLPLLAWPAVVGAQENETSAPPPLQWPALEPGPTANGGFGINILRLIVEEEANAELCKAMMKHVGDPIPPAFTFNMCPSKFKDPILARQGLLKWGPGARPTECGTNCVSRPAMTRSMSRNEPNEIFAQLFGHLDFMFGFDALNRTVRYGYAVQFHCPTRGMREGDFTIRVLFDKPFVLKGGTIEGIADALFPTFDISNRIEGAISNRLLRPNVGDKTFRRCNSIGVDTTGEPSGDGILYNSPRPSKKPKVLLFDDNALSRRSATVRFLRVTRKPVSGFTPPAETGRFHIFLNGVQGNFPDPPGLNLPATGGSAELNLCKTIDLNGADRLQLIFVNSHGGAVWSQFEPNTSFGAGPARTMTTSRIVKAAGRPGPSNLPNGKPGRTQPDIFVLREFELSYTIEFHAPPGKVIAPQPVIGGGKKSSQVGQISDVPVNDSKAGQPTQPCRQI